MATFKSISCVLDLSFSAGLRVLLGTAMIHLGSRRISTPGAAASIPSGFSLSHGDLRYPSNPTYCHSIGFVAIPRAPTSLLGCNSQHSLARSLKASKITNAGVRGNKYPCCTKQIKFASRNEKMCLPPWRKFGILASSFLFLANGLTVFAVSLFRLGLG